MPDKKSTRPGSVDDNVVKRIKARKRKQEKTLQEIFNDNSTGRNSGPQDK